LRERTIRGTGADVAMRTLEYEDDRVARERIEDRDGGVTDVAYTYHQGRRRSTSAG